MPLPREAHARLFNRLGRIVGVSFLLGGLLFVVVGLSLVFDKDATIVINDVPTSDPWQKAILPVVGAGAALIGVLLLIARPYRSPNESA